MTSTTPFLSPQQDYFFGSDLRTLRRFAGVDSGDIAAFAGVKSGKTIENWERGRGKPSVDQFVAISIGLGFDPAKLTGFYLHRTSPNEQPNIQQMRIVRSCNKQLAVSDK